MQKIYFHALILVHFIQLIMTNNRFIFPLKLLAVILYSRMCGRLHIFSLFRQVSIAYGIGTLSGRH